MKIEDGKVLFCGEDRTEQEKDKDRGKISTCRLLNLKKIFMNNVEFMLENPMSSMKIKK